MLDVRFFIHNLFYGIYILGLFTVLYCKFTPNATNASYMVFTVLRNVFHYPSWLYLLFRRFGHFN